MLYLQIFLYLQFLDFLTTMVGLRLGLSEASPFVNHLMHFGPTSAVLLSKLIAVGLAGLCVVFKRRFLIGWINYWYAALVIWNLGNILLAPAMH
jgi:hypothetical protein